tara:strand:+ start:161 stop:364 length:204 start_codon:yes stop_codon:yes gene_type:complete
MGVIQKILSRAEFKDHKFGNLTIEYNGGDWVHLQNDSVRIEMLQEEFIHFATAVIKSANQMIEYKGL